MNIGTITANPALEEKLLEADEGHFLDFKSKRIKAASVQEHFVSFANTDGGELYIGIEDKKMQGERISGFVNAEEANSVVQLLFTQTEPSVEGVQVEYINFGKRGLVLHFFIPKRAVCQELCKLAGAAGWLAGIEILRSFKLRTMA